MIRKCRAAAPSPLGEGCRKAAGCVAPAVQIAKKLRPGCVASAVQITKQYGDNNRPYLAGQGSEEAGAEGTFIRVLRRTAARGL